MITPERLLEHADTVRVARNRDRDRARRKLDRLNKKIETGEHDHLAAFRAKIAARAGVER